MKKSPILIVSLLVFAYLFSACDLPPYENADFLGTWTVSDENTEVIIELDEQGEYSWVIIPTGGTVQSYSGTYTATSVVISFDGNPTGFQIFSYEVIGNTFILTSTEVEYPINVVFTRQ